LADPGIASLLDAVGRAEVLFRHHVLDVRALEERDVLRLRHAHGEHRAAALTGRAGAAAGADAVATAGSGPADGSVITSMMFSLTPAFCSLSRSAGVSVYFLPSLLRVL